MKEMSVAHPDVSLSILMKDTSGCATLISFMKGLINLEIENRLIDQHISICSSEILVLE